MRDQQEMAEDLAEKLYDEGSQDNGLFKCCCGELFDPENEGGTISPDPYAMTVCNPCLRSAYID